MKKLCCILFICFLSTNAIALGKEGKVAVIGGNIWYSIQGEGKATPVIVIHGGPGGSTCGYDSLAALGKHRPVIFYDQLGAGRSDQPTDASLWQVERFATELNALITSLQFSKVHLLAHSWGAAIAAQYLIDKGSTKIASVIYADPYLSSKDWIAGTNELRKQLSPATQALLHKHEIAGTTSSTEYQNASAEFYEKFLFHNPHADPVGCSENTWNAAIYESMWGNSEFEVQGNLKNFEIINRLQKIKIPTLFIVGEFDEVPETTARLYQQKISGAELVVIKNAAHMSMVDNSVAFNKAVDNFLQKVDRTATNIKKIEPKKSSVKKTDKSQ